MALQILSNTQLHVAQTSKVDMLNIEEDWEERTQKSWKQSDKVLQIWMSKYPLGCWKSIQKERVWKEQNVRRATDVKCSAVSNCCEILKIALFPQKLTSNS